MHIHAGKYINVWKGRKTSLNVHPYQLGYYIVIYGMLHNPASELFNPLFVHFWVE